MAAYEKKLILTAAFDHFG